MSTARVSSKGQVVIPAEMRKRHGIRPGTPIGISERDGVIVLRPLDEKFFDQLAGALGTEGGSWTDALIEEHRLDREREDK